MKKQKPKYIRHIVIGTILAVGVIKLANMGISTIEGNKSLKSQILTLEQEREQQRVKEAQQLSLLSDLENKKAEEQRKTIPLSTRLQLPKVAVLTGYSCGGLETEAEIQMNCPSIKKHKAGLTATGTTPIPYATAACDRINLGKTFRIEGFTTVTCTDTGGAIKGENRFDIVFPTKQDAIEFGVKYYPYQEV